MLIFIYYFFIMAAKSVNRYEKEWKIYKQCSYCLEYIEATKEYFSWKETWFMWLCSICKNCEHKKYIINKDKRLKQSKERYTKNKDKILLQVKKYYLKHKEEKIDYAKNYRTINKEIIKKKDKDRYWQWRYWISTEEEILNHKIKKKKEWVYDRPKENRATFHWRTYDFINKYWLRPNVCQICWAKRRINAHHPSYDKRYEVVFCCSKCHINIHAWNIKCPEPINILELIK